MKKLLLLTISALLCAAAAWADAPTTIVVSEDTYVYGQEGSNSNGKWDVSYGDNQYIITLYNDSYFTKKMGFLKFDLASLAAVDFSTVTSVKLKMYYEYMTENTGVTGGSANIMKVYNMNLVSLASGGQSTTDFGNSWTEETLTLNAWKGTADVSISSGATLKAYSGMGGDYNYYFRRNPDKTSDTNYNGNAAYLIAQRDITAEGEGQWIPPPPPPSQKKIADQ